MYSMWWLAPREWTDILKDATAPARAREPDAPLAVGTRRLTMEPILTPAETQHLPDTRNDFGALIHVPAWARQLVSAAEKAGTYTAGIASNRRHTRGTAINADVYGYDKAQQLAVIQVRECRFRQGRFPKVRKDYYLVGYVESGEAFAHPVDSPARSKTALASPEACVAWVLAKIWDCAVADVPEIRRQGDIAFVPALLPLGAKPLVVQTITIRGTHVITAHLIYEYRCPARPYEITYYVARKARAVHTKGEHATVMVRHGYFRVQPGIRAKVWAFTAPVGD